MLIACWSAKGGTGTTVVSAGLAAVLSRSSPAGALLVDLAGDLPAVVALDQGSSGPGLAEWLVAGPDVPADGLGSLEIPVRPGLSLLTRGEGQLDHGERAEVLVALLSADPRPVVVDCGLVPVHGRGPGGEAALAAVASASASLLVLRPCYLALRRASLAPIRASGVVLVTEPDRAIGAAEVEAVLGVPVRARVALDGAVARAVDAGTLLHRLPRTLARGLRAAA
jgi:hypothetical protein